MEQERAEVERCWRNVHYCDGSYQGYPRGTILILYGPNNRSDFDSWHAAYLYTVEHAEKVKEVREEITWLKSLNHVTHMNAAIRTLRRAEVELDNLLRGWKG
jgi:hypothetical protein